MVAIENTTLSQCIEVLEWWRHQVSKVLQEFARPVAACDVDYDTLLAERAELAAALSHLRPLCHGEMKIPDPREDLVARSIRTHLCICLTPQRSVN